MSHAPARSLRRAVQCFTVTGLLAAALAPLAAGQIPNVRRRATDAAARAAGVQPQGEDVKFDDVMLELTPQRLDQVLKGLRARRAALDGRGGEPSVNALRSQRDAASQQATALRSSHGAEMDAYHQRNDQVRNCREGAFQNKSDARREASGERAMTDPTFMQKISELTQRVQEAQARGDTAAARRLVEEVNNLVAAPTKEDSVAVDRQCGRPPAPPPSVARLDSLQALEARNSERLRQREKEADSLAVRGSGLTAEQMAMAVERAEMYVAQIASESPHRGFTGTELSALDARRKELEELL